MPVNYPQDADADTNKLEYCFNALKKLRDTHNLIGKWRRGELSQMEYDSLPDLVKATWNYNDHQPSLPDSAFRAFKSNYYEGREKAILAQVNDLKKSLENSAKWMIDLDAI